MKNYFIILFTLTLISCTSSRDISSVETESIDLKTELELIRKRYNLPSLAAVIITDGGIKEIAATGKRAFDHAEEVTIYDKYHLGSNTKSMTATLLARFVEKNILNWSDSLSDVFTDYHVHEELKNVTLESLLRHKGGVTSAFSKSYPLIWKKFYTLQGKVAPINQRILLSKTILKDKPIFKINDKSNYSNAGITLVGHAIEEKLGKSYEKLLKNEVFDLLGMKSCGFGTPGSATMVDQPRGHVVYEGKLYSVPPGPTADNPDAITPAGKVHCSLVDWGKYISNHLLGEMHGSNLLKVSSYKKLHSTLTDDVFALGWIKRDLPWNTKKKGMFHNGSNTMNYAEMWFSTEDNIGIGVVTNIGTAPAMKAVNEAVRSIVQKRI